MNAKHPEYEIFLKDTIDEITARIHGIYAPYEMAATATDIAHFHLHVNCSLLVRFLLQMQGCSKTADGKEPELQTLLDEFIRIMRTCIDQTMTRCKEDIH
jgi:hypothetical protein